MIILVEILIAYIAVYLLTPIIIKKAEERQLVGIDRYKPQRKMVAEMGGIGILIGYMLALLPIIYLLPGVGKYHILAALTSITFIAVVGFIDDLFELRQSIKAILPLLGAIPLMVTNVGVTTMFFPIVGAVDLGLLYPLIIIPVGVTAASNLTNMLAGFNGLEAGLGVISSVTILLAAILSDRPETMIIVAPLIGSLLAFLRYNWHPARIFPGDSGTLMIGGVISAAVIVGNMELVGFFVFSLYTINFLMYTLNLNKFLIHRDWKFGKVDPEGYIKPPSQDCWYSVYYLIPKYFRLKEKDLVKVILGVQSIICLIVLIWIWWVVT